MFIELLVIYNKKKKNTYNYITYINVITLQQNDTIQKTSNKW